MLYFPMGEVVSLLQTRVPRFGVGAHVCFLAYGASVILLYFLSLALKYLFIIYFGGCNKKEIIRNKLQSLLLRWFLSLHPEIE